jgi:hypothetical protein
MKTDMDRVLDGLPRVVGKHAALLQDFNLKPRDMLFNRLKLWVRIEPALWLYARASGLVL